MSADVLVFKAQPTRRHRSRMRSLLPADRQRVGEFAQLFRLYRELGDIDRSDIAALIEFSHACSLRVVPARAQKGGGR